MSAPASDDPPPAALPAAATSTPAGTRARRLLPRAALGLGGAVAAGFLALCLRALN